jgi:N-acetyl-anhydromuramyl-L-alanine amidase AmpD
MYIIKDVEYLDKEKLNITRKKTKKTQIFLFDTQRRIEDYLAKIKYRKNGGYKDIPHFVVAKNGIIYKIFDSDFYSDTFNKKNFDKKLIKIAIENLGWLNKNTITGILNNWIGDAHRSEPHIKSWRNHIFWDKYTDDQFQSLSKLCEELCEKHDIKKESVNTQAFFKSAHNFEGIICKSNFSDIYTDINPSFNFNIFFKNAKE